MTTNAAPLTRRNLRTATDAWKAEATYPDIVDKFIAEIPYEAADSTIAVMAQELAGQVDDMSYMDALEVLAKIGIAWAVKDNPR